MKIFVRFALSLTFLIFCFAPFAFAQNVEPQSSPESESKEQIELKAKALALLNRALDEAASLKLAENRVLIRATAARLLWEKDEKQARKLVQSVVAELIAAQNALPARVEDNPRQEYYWRLIQKMLRQQLLAKVQQKDAELALEMCYQTRAPELDAAVRRYQQILLETGKPPDYNRLKDDERQRLELAAEEIRFEQTLQKAVAKNDLPKIAANIRQSIARRGEHYQILADIDELNQKDHETAQKLLTEYVQFVAADSAQNHLNAYLAYVFFTRYAAASDKPAAANDKNRALEVDRSTVKTIAAKELERMRKSDNGNDFSFVEHAVYLRKVLPERFDEIRPRYEAAKARGAMRDWANDAEASEELGDNPTLADVIKNNDRLHPNSRANYYQRIIAKLLETEPEERIEQLLAPIPDDKERAAALDNLKSQTATKKAAQENFAAAKSSINAIKSAPERIARLVALAQTFSRKKTGESQKIAEDLLAEAEKLVNTNAETASQREALFPVIAAYAEIKPERAFELVAPLVARSNELINAYVLLANYDDASYPYVSENEIVFGAQDGYHSYKWRYGKIIKQLAAHNFAAAERLINSFDRADVRLIAKLALVESVFGQ